MLSELQTVAYICFVFDHYHVIFPCKDIHSFLVIKTIFFHKWSLHHSLVSLWKSSIIIGIKMRSTFKPNYRYDNGKIKFNRTVYCPIKICFEKVDVDKRHFRLSEEMIINFLNAFSYVSSVITALKNKQTCSSSCETKWFTFLKERENQSKILLQTCVAQILKTKSMFTI